MTFDARGGSRSGSGSSNFLFGGGVIAVVGIAFAATFLIGGGSDSNRSSAKTVHITSVDTAQAPAQITLAATDLSGAFKSRAAKGYFDTLAAVDARAYQKLETKLQRATRSSATKRFEIVMEHGVDVLKSNAGDLARADARHLDTLLNHTRANLKRAASSKSSWCKGSTYAHLDRTGIAGARKMQKEFTAMEGPVQDFSFEAMNILMAAILDARANPVKHGKLQPRDEMAVQGVMMSMMSDPQVMPLLIGAQTGQSPEKLIASLNVCELAATFASAAKTLPQDTKGRVWAELVRETELGGGDIGRYGNMAGF